MGQPGDVFVDQRLSFHRGQALVLQIIPARIGGAAEQESTLAVVLQVGRDRVKPHEGRQRDRIGAIALEGFDGVLLGGAADVTALGVQNHRHVGRRRLDVGHQPLELVFGAVGREVRDLGLERHGQIGGGVHDGGAEIEDPAGVAFQRTREARGIGVQAHTQQGTVLRFGALQHVGEGHAGILFAGQKRPAAR